ncbi:unnamed protein product [Phytomonas sp. EM1]|nr:unnamed protein product [Phytomonas sp. EM1]|eukprot:CCW64082.1 unnamed protein product [Phytomonas sp. isolate EM1]
MDGLVEISPNHFTLKKSHPVYVALREKSTRLRKLDSSKEYKPLYDVTTITESPELFKTIIDWLATRYRAMGSDGPTHILGIDSCGCYIGAPLALVLGIPFLPLRRGALTEGDFVMEGENKKAPNPPLFVRNGSLSPDSRVVVVDDFIANGRTLEAALDCVQVVGSKVLEAIAMCEIIELEGFKHVHDIPNYKDVRLMSLFRLHKVSEVLFMPRRFQAKI